MKKINFPLVPFTRGRLDDYNLIKLKNNSGE
jgi:hypothetical protein